MIVSSTSELRLLGVLVRRRLGELSLSLGSDEVERGSRANEERCLVGLRRHRSAGRQAGCLRRRDDRAWSSAAICSPRSSSRRPAADRSFSVFFLLDDYADWLAQRESRIADILALCVEESEDGIRLRIAVVESKYVAADGAAEARRSSKAQLLATLATFRAALFGDPGRLDRDVWLSRLADMLIDAEIPPGLSGLLERARAKLREGDVDIALRGYSHVFIHSAEAGQSQSASEQIEIDNTDGVQAWQEVFDRPELRKLVEAYAAGTGATDVRALLGGAEPWKSVAFKRPAARVAWHAMMEQLGQQTVQGQEVVVDGGASPASLIDPACGPRVRCAAAGRASCQAETSRIVLVAAAMGHHLSALIAAKQAGLAVADDEREAWAQETTKKLKTALNSYGLQAAVLGTRMTPNGCLVRLGGLRPAEGRGHRGQAHPASDHARDQPGHRPAQARRDRGDDCRRQAAVRLALGLVGQARSSIATSPASTPRSSSGCKRSTAHCCI